MQKFQAQTLGNAWGPPPPANQEVKASASNLVFSLESMSILGQEVVVAASRTPERILESPVSIERYGQAAIRETAAPSFYDALKSRDA